MSKKNKLNGSLPPRNIHGFYCTADAEIMYPRVWTLTTSEPETE